MQALATYTGYLQCWDWFDFREGGGARGTQLAIWPDRLEITTHGVSR
jgi:hypothetical protein